MQQAGETKGVLNTPGVHSQTSAVTRLKPTNITVGTDVFISDSYGSFFKLHMMLTFTFPHFFISVKSHKITSSAA